MFKKFRIKNEGLHRIGIVIGILFIICFPWFVLGIFNGFDYELIEVINAHAIFIEEIFEGGGALFLIFLMYPLSYFVGYFIVSIISWLREK